MIRGQRKSLQLPMNTNIASVIRSERAAGIITFHHSPRGEQPSMGISVSSAHRIDAGRLQPKAVKPRTRRHPDPLVQVWSRCCCLFWSTIQPSPPNPCWSTYRSKVRSRLECGAPSAVPLPPGLKRLGLRADRPRWRDFRGPLGGAAERPGCLRRGAHGTAHRSTDCRPPTATAMAATPSASPCYQILCAHYGLRASRG